MTGTTGPLSFDHVVQKSGSRKQRYLDATIDQLMATGLNDFSLRELASQLETSHRVLIYHFSSKENLVNEAVQEIRRRELDLFQASGARITDGRTSDVLMGFYEHNTSEDMRAYFRLFYEVWGIAMTDPARYEKFLDGIVSNWVESLSLVLVRAGYTIEEAGTRATLTLAAMRGLQLDYFTTGDRERTTDAYASLVSLFEEEIAGLSRSQPTRRKDR